MNLMLKVTILSKIGRHKIYMNWSTWLQCDNEKKHRSVYQRTGKLKTLNFPTTLCYIESYCLTFRSKCHICAYTEVSYRNDYNYSYNKSIGENLDVFGPRQSMTFFTFIHISRYSKKQILLLFILNFSLLL